LRARNQTGREQASPPVIPDALISRFEQLQNVIVHRKDQQNPITRLSRAAFGPAQACSARFTEHPKALLLGRQGAGRGWWSKEFAGVDFPRTQFAILDSLSIGTIPRTPPAGGFAYTNRKHKRAGLFRPKLDRKIPLRKGLRCGKESSAEVQSRAGTATSSGWRSAGKQISHGARRSQKILSRPRSTRFPRSLGAKSRAAKCGPRTKGVMLRP